MLKVIHFFIFYEKSEVILTCLKKVGTGATKGWKNQWFKKKKQLKEHAAT